MYKLFVLALVFGLCASVPLRLNETRLADEENVALESALMIPEFEIETNRTVLLETMPQIMEVVEEKILNATLRTKEFEKNETEWNTTTTTETNTTMEMNMNKRNYGGYETSSVPMIPAPVESTTESYGGYETSSVPMIPAPVESTTESYGGYETSSVPMIPAPVESTTESYESDVPQFVGVVSSGYKKREAPVRTIMDKITIFIQEKHSNMANFIATEYCAKKSGMNHVTFQYYKPYPNDQTRYVQCDTWGRGTVRECSEGRLWDQFYEMCTVPSVIQDSQNMTQYFEELSKLQLSESCNSTLFSCVNGGKCVERESEWQCQCTRAFTGPFCQFRVEEGSIFSAIMTGQFNYTKFEDFAVKTGLNDTLVGNDLKALSQLTNTTHRQIIDYIDMFDEEHVRYDTAVNLLIEDVLEDIYPDLYYMSIFNVSENSLLHVVRTIPALVSYSRYSTERYTEVLSKYNDVIERLMFTLNESIPNSQEVALEYTRIVAHIMNETGTTKGMQDTFNRTTEAQLEQGMQKTYNKTSEEFMEFSLAMNAMRSYFIDYMRSHPETVNMRVGMLPLTNEVKELISIFDEMTIQSVMLINQLFNYGFWTVTEALAGQI